MHSQIYGSHIEDGSSSTFSLNPTATTTTTTSTINNINNSNNNTHNGQDGSTIESNHSSPVWSIPSTSSSIAMPVSTGNGSHSSVNADIFSPEPYALTAMAVSRYADDFYMNCYSTKMNSILLARAANNKLNDPANAYNCKQKFISDFFFL